jgi:ABC-type antimicrobial peptide transport system permease subunit
MSKSIKMLAICLLIALGGISQTSDSICLPLVQVKKAIAIIEKSKITENELTLTKLQVDLMKDRLAIKDTIINEITHINKFMQKTIQNHELSEQNNKEAIQKLQKSLNLSEKSYERQKSSKWIVGITGLILGIFIGL